MLTRKGLSIFIVSFVAFYSILFATVYYFGNQFSGQNEIDEIDVANVQSEYDDSRTFGEFNEELVDVPPKEYDSPIDLNNLAANLQNADGDPQGDSKVLGDSDEKDYHGNPSDSKRIEVDLTNQKLYAFEGDKKVYEFLVSTGKWGKTYPGEYRIWTKMRYTKMSGGSKALHTYYYLPNVPFTMFFSNDKIPASRGYGIHGTYWHNNFGHPMSHGCINMKNEEAEILYYWANPVLPEGKKSTPATKDNPGTKIVIYGTTPKS